MSVKPLTSYFLFFTGTDAEKKRFAKTLNEIYGEIFDAPHLIDGEIFDAPELSDGTYRFQLLDGSTDRINDAQEEFAAIMKQFPNCTLTVMENCEEQLFPDTKYTYENGVLKQTLYGRTLGPDEYDEKTARNCLKRIYKHLVPDEIKPGKAGKCPACGSFAPVGCSFCPNCGEPLTEDALDILARRIDKARVKALSDMNFDLCGKKRMNLTIVCDAVYNTSINIPDYIGDDRNLALTYANENLDKTDLAELEYIGHERLDEDNCGFDD